MNLLALAIFCIVSAATPGPNNLMLMSSGATFGLRRTLPHMAGITVGCALMVLAIGFSLGGIARRLPALHSVLHIISAAYLLWLAWRIATAAPPDEAAATGRPMTALQAALFQWVNPKAWAMILGAVTIFARPERMTADVLTIALTLVAITIPCIALWAGAGTLLRRLLRTPAALRGFNFAMAALLVLSILPGLRDAFA